MWMPPPDSRSQTERAVGINWMGARLTDSQKHRLSAATHQNAKQNTQK